MDSIQGANEPRFLIDVEGIDAALRVMHFSGKEQISHLFHFEIHIESDLLDIDPSDVIAAKTTFSISFQGHFRTIRGIVGQFEFTGLERNVACYKLDLVPDIALLNQKHQLRIFQDMTAVDILKQVLETADISTSAFQVSCTESYSPLEFCVQYRERDLDFFNRMAERFGIFHFFEFSESATELILGDDPGVHPEISDSGELHFHMAGDLADYDDFVYEMKIGRTLRTNKHTVRDYNFQSPQVDLTKDHSGDGNTDLEWYDFPGSYTSQDAGGTAAQIRSLAEDACRSFGAGKSNSVRLAPGHKFNLIGHELDSLNQSYLVVSVSHRGAQPTPDNMQPEELGYSNEFRVLPATIPFKKLATTPKPLIDGSQTATVTGPEGHEIYSDEFGRIKVRFHWDRDQTPEEKSSCWVRVAQPWAGKSWGAMFIPRIGQEVLISFLEGDPDRPIIAGCVYNGTNMPPYPLPDKQTVSTIRSESSLGGEGFNEFRYEDEKGSEQIYLHAEKDYQIEVNNNKDQSVGANETLSVSKNRNRSVEGNESVSVKGNRTHSVEGNQSISVSGNETVSVSGNESVTISKNNTISVSKDRSVSTGKNDSHDIGENATLTIGDKSDETVGKTKQVQIGDDLKVSVGKNYACDVGDSILVSGGNEITFKCGSASIVLKKNGDIQLKGKEINLRGSGNLVLKGSKIIQN